MPVSQRRGLLLSALLLVVSALVSTAILQHRGAHRLAEATARFERTFGALDPGAHAPAALPDEDNAATWIQRATSSLALTKADKTMLDDVLTNTTGVPEAAVHDLLARHIEALENYRRAGALTASSFGIDYEVGQQTSLPALMDMMVGKKLMLVDGRMGLAEADFERAIVNAAGLAALRRALAAEPMLVFQLIAMNVEIAHHELLQDLLSSERVTLAMVERLADQLGGDSHTQTVQTALAVEAGWMLAAIDAAAVEPRAWWAMVRQLPDRLSAPFEAAAMIDLYHAMAEAAALPGAQVQTHLAAGMPANPVAGVIARTLIPNVISCLERSRANAASRRAARLALSLRGHALRHGGYPDSLDDVSRASAPEPFGHGPLVLTRHADGTATLDLPEATALWRARFAHVPQPGPRFTWHLPKPHRSKPGGPGDLHGKATAADHRMDSPRSEGPDPA